MVEKANKIWADGPSSAPFQPFKPDIRAWGTWIESIIGAFFSTGGKIYQTRALLNADLTPAANSIAWVMEDPTVANNGIYRKVGGTGTGSWVRAGDLPFSFIVASNPGAGTANAIQATTSIPVSSSALSVLPISATNTATPVTVSLNGGAAITIKAFDGADIIPSGLTAGMVVMGYVSGSTFRLISDQSRQALNAALNAAVEAAEAARDLTEEYRDEAEEARDVALGAAGDTVAQGFVPIYDSRTSAAAYDLSAFSKVTINRWSSSSKIASADYEKVAFQPSHQMKFVDAGSNWWSIAATDISPEMAGALGDGTTDDSEAFQRALSVVASQVVGNARSSYSVKDIVLNSKVLDANGAGFVPAAGAKWMIRLSGYIPQLKNARMQDFEGRVVRSANVATGSAVATGSQTLKLSSVSGLEVGMLATVATTVERWHNAFITAIDPVAGTITLARGLEFATAVGAVVDCSWGMININGAIMARVFEATLTNVSFGLVVDNDPNAGHFYPATTGCIYENLRISDVRHVAFAEGRNCADSQFLNMTLRSGVTSVSNYIGNGVTASFQTSQTIWLLRDVSVRVNGALQTRGTSYVVTDAKTITFQPGFIPADGAAIVISQSKDGKSGFFSDATGWTIIRGGNRTVGLEVLDFIRGIEQHNKELCSLEGIISDTISGEAIVLNSCVDMDFGQTFAGFSHQPILAKGGSDHIRFNQGLLTTRITPNLTAANLAGTEDITVEGGSRIDINAPSWAKRSTRTFAGGGVVNLNGSITLYASSVTAVAAAATMYYGPDGMTAGAGGNAWVTPRELRIKKIKVQCSAAPGIGQTFTYELFVNGVATGAILTISGSGSFGAELVIDVYADTAKPMNVRLVTSGGAASTTHRLVLEAI